MSTNAVIIGEKKLKLYLEKVQKNLIPKKLLEEIGHFVDLQVLERTLKGVNASNNPFPGYSFLWKKIRKEAGLQVRHVDLFFTGNMFGALTHTVSENKVTSFFMSTPIGDGDGDIEGNAEIAFYNDERYNFFALSNEDVTGIFKLVDEYIDKVI